MYFYCPQVYVASFSNY